MMELLCIGSVDDGITLHRFSIYLIGLIILYEIRTEKDVL